MRGGEVQKDAEHGASRSRVAVLITPLKRVQLAQGLRKRFVVPQQDRASAQARKLRQLGVEAVEALQGVPHAHAVGGHSSDAGLRHDKREGRRRPKKLCAARALDFFAKRVVRREGLSRRGGLPELFKDLSLAGCGARKLGEGAQKNRAAIGPGPCRGDVQSSSAAAIRLARVGSGMQQRFKHAGSQLFGRSKRIVEDLRIAAESRAEQAVAPGLQATPGLRRAGSSPFVLVNVPTESHADGFQYDAPPAAHGPRLEAEAVQDHRRPHQWVGIHCTPHGIRVLQDSEKVLWTFCGLHTFYKQQNLPQNGSTGEGVASKRRLRCQVDESIVVSCPHGAMKQPSQLFQRQHVLASGLWPRAVINLSTLRRQERKKSTADA
eukprot:scaffold459_cov249-Pinguiococcus_pyrenoidosus.AAC.20